MIDHINQVFESLGQINCLFFVLFAEVDIDADFVNHLLEARQVLAFESLFKEVIVVEERKLSHALGIVEFGHVRGLEVTDRNILNETNCSKIDLLIIQA